MIILQLVRRRRRRHEERLIVWTLFRLHEEHEDWVGLALGIKVMRKTVRLDGQRAKDEVDR